MSDMSPKEIEAELKRLHSELPFAGIHAFTATHSRYCGEDAAEIKQRETRAIKLQAIDLIHCHPACRVVFAIIHGCEAAKARRHKEDLAARHDIIKKAYSDSGDCQKVADALFAMDDAWKIMRANGGSSYMKDAYHELARFHEGLSHFPPRRPDMNAHKFEYGTTCYERNLKELEAA